MNIIKLISPGGVVRKWGIQALDNIRKDIAYRKAKGLQSADLFQVGDQSYELIGG